MKYRVIYQSMTAFYGPSFIDAESEYEARRRFAGTAFSQSEMSLIKATPVSASDIQRALQAMSDDV